MANRLKDVAQADAERMASLAAELKVSPIPRCDCILATGSNSLAQFCPSGGGQQAAA
jgi:hypothetical protein